MESAHKKLGKDSNLKKNILIFGNTNYHTFHSVSYVAHNALFDCTTFISRRSRTPKIHIWYMRMINWPSWSRTPKRYIFMHYTCKSLLCFRLPLSYLWRFFKAALFLPSSFLILLNEFELMVMPVDFDNKGSYWIIFGHVWSLILFFL